MKDAKGYAKKEGPKIASTNVGYFSDGSNIGDSIDEAAAWADLSRDWAISPNLVQDPVATDYSSKYYAAEAKKVSSGVVGEGDKQIARVVAEGDIQVARVSSEGDTQFGRASAAADKAEESAEEAKLEANRAEYIANSLDDALRNGGYFNVSVLAYPTPIDIAIPYAWFCLDTGDIGDGIIWSEGDLLQYVPHASNPTIFGQYYRVAGELASDVPPTPQPISILDDLIMYQDKKIIFQTASGTAQSEVLHLDTEGDVVIGQHTTGGRKLNKIGLASESIWHIKELSTGGIASEAYAIITDELGEVARADYVDSEILAATQYGILLFGESTLPPTSYATTEYVDLQDSSQDAKINDIFTGEEFATVEYVDTENLIQDNEVDIISTGVNYIGEI